MWPGLKWTFIFFAEHIVSYKGHLSGRASCFQCDKGPTFTAGELVMKTVSYVADASNNGPTYEIEKRLRVTGHVPLQR